MGSPTYRPQLLFSRLLSGADPLATAAGSTEYQNDPTNTITAPPASWAFHPVPNHHTLKHKLIALRAINQTGWRET